MSDGPNSEIPQGELVKSREQEPRIGTVAHVEKQLEKDIRAHMNLSSRRQLGENVDQAVLEQAWERAGSAYLQGTILHELALGKYYEDEDGLNFDDAQARIVAGRPHGMELDPQKHDELAKNMSAEEGAKRVDQWIQRARAKGTSDEEMLTSAQKLQERLTEEAQKSNPPEEN